MEPLSNLLNGVLHFGFRMLLKQWAKKERRWHISKEKTDEKVNGATMMISVDRKGTVFPVKLKLEGDLWVIKKENFIKDLIDLTETNYRISMTSDHFVSTNK